MRDAHVERLIDRAVRSVQDDTASGATALALKALSAIGALIEALPDDERTRARVLDLSNRLVEARPSMCAVGNLVRTFREALPTDFARTDSRAALQTVLHEAAEATRATIRIATDTLARSRRLMTHSHSSTVARVLARLEGVSVLCTRSAPGDDGVRLVANLERVGIGAMLVEDAAAPRELAGIDALVIGADALIDDGRVVNKIGSAALARAARAADKPVWVVAESFKRLAAPPVLEPVFELVPAEHVSGVLGDRLFGAGR